MTYSLADLLAMARKRGDTELVKRLEELIEKKEQMAGKLMGETSAPENASNEGAHVTSDAVCNAGRERATDAESRKAGPQPEVGRESSGHCLHPRQGPHRRERQVIDWRFLLALAALMLSMWAFLIFLVLACMEAVS